MSSWKEGPAVIFIFWISTGGADYESYIEKGVPVFPGCVNASDVTRAVNAGLKVVKFFPAEQSGGVAFLKSLAPVFPSVNFMPTGGVNTKNLMDYLSFDRIAACGGTWMVKKDLINGEKWSLTSPPERPTRRDRPRRFTFWISTTASAVLLCIWCGNKTV